MRRIALSGRGGGLLIFLVGHMVADDASADGAQYAVMPCVMAGDAADHRALDAARGFGGRGRRAETGTRESIIAATGANFMAGFRC